MGSQEVEISQIKQLYNYEIDPLIDKEGWFKLQGKETDEQAYIRCKEFLKFLKSISSYIKQLQTKVK